MSTSNKHEVENLICPLRSAKGAHDYSDGIVYCTPHCMLFESEDLNDGCNDTITVHVCGLSNNKVMYASYGISK